jgi:hypothetical protein
LTIRVSPQRPHRMDKNQPGKALRGNARASPCEGQGTLAGGRPDPPRRPVRRHRGLWVAAGPPSRTLQAKKASTSGLGSRGSAVRNSARSRFWFAATMMVGNGGRLGGAAGGNLGRGYLPFSLRLRGTDDHRRKRSPPRGASSLAAVAVAGDDDGHGAVAIATPFRCAA